MDDFFAQLCVYLDIGHFLVEACYFLEGDGYLILRAFETLENVEVNLRQQAAGAGVRSQTQVTATDVARQPAIYAKMRLALKPAYDYMVAKMTIKFVESMNIMKAARYWDPRRFVDLHKAANQTLTHKEEVMTDIGALNWLDKETKELLLTEFQSYYAAARGFGVPLDEDPDSLFKRFFSDGEHQRNFPTWCAQFFLVILLQTSEGTVERSFSDFSNIQNDLQTLRTEETLATSVVARYNARDDRPEEES
jgi:hypothetical protein